MANGRSLEPPSRWAVLRKAGGLLFGLDLLAGYARLAADGEARKLWWVGALGLVVTIAVVHGVVHHVRMPRRRTDGG